MFFTVWETAERLFVRHFDADKDVFVAELTDKEIETTMREVWETWETEIVAETARKDKDYVIRTAREEAIAVYNHKVTVGNALKELMEHLEWLESHNKQYTKEQYSRIDDALGLARVLREEIENFV